MKKDRNCGNTNYPMYPMMGQMPMQQGIMPNIGMMPNMNMPNMGINLPSGNGITSGNINSFETEINRLEQRINMLERRINTLETSGNTNNNNNNNYSTYNSSGYQML